ncbi:potassium transporter Kup [Hyphomicrobium nitrativorans NL23]|uniref:Probable potassium transport system protein Kup n=1 Tax=Hyphomicrobium nitrativorans NL23 TaxID=1029756 RepID=V5SFY4_9HYPH|nr:potassium transporter Kup [Hyphomicrobium nitrativorans NL23]
MAHPRAAEAGKDPEDARLDKRFWLLVVGAIGVVYGDIGTSPLYAFREAVRAASGGSPANTEAVFGVLSLIFWALVLIVTLKYVIVLLRADNKGEGGTFALMALGLTVSKRSSPLLLALGVAGASFFYGDAVLTPAISVLSAVEGLALVSPVFERWIVPLALVVIVALFAVQSRGTARVAQFFGPLTVFWFLMLGGGGLWHVVDNPSVLAALNPWYGLQFLVSHGLLGLTVFGFVFLAVTGAEALYADLGHFGRKPIQVAWVGFVFPALMLNYMGQGALVLADASTIQNPFYRLYPEWALVPMVVLATAATVVASQAVITGAFSLARQAIQLGLLPRFAVRHTSEEMAGQIYLPRVNWLLLIGVVFTVVTFKSSSNLASAYGVSVTATLVINSLVAFFVLWKYWRWPLWKVAALMLPLLVVELTFFAANAMKFFEGAWFPVLVAAVLSLIMFTWMRGYRILSRITRRDETELDWLVRRLEAKPPARVPGTAVFLSADVNAAPTALMHNLKHNRVLHERNVVLSISTDTSKPRVPRHERVHIDRSNEMFTRVVATYGFMESPNIPKILEGCRRKDLNIDIGATSFFLSRRSLRPSSKSEMPRWQTRLFIWLARTSEDATTYFRIPTDRVVEVGTQVAI